MSTMEKCPFCPSFVAKKRYPQHYAVCKARSEARQRKATLQQPAAASSSDAPDAEMYDDEGMFDEGGITEEGPIAEEGPTVDAGTRFVPVAVRNNVTADKLLELQYEALKLDPVSTRMNPRCSSAPSACIMTGAHDVRQEADPRIAFGEIDWTLMRISHKADISKDDSADLFHGLRSVTSMTGKPLVINRAIEKLREKGMLLEHDTVEFWNGSRLPRDWRWPR